MKRQLLRSRSARFESLERKEMLAGDVLVSVVHGNLKLEGDALDNHVAVTAGAEAGTYLVIGLDGTNLRLVDPSTDLPGDPVGELQVEARGGLKVDLGDDNDSIALADVDFRGRVKIEMGGGNDGVFVGSAAAAELVGVASLEEVSVGLRGGLYLDLGEGDDEAVVADVGLRSYLKVNAGAGDDAVMLGAAVAAGLNGDADGEFADAVLKVKAGIHVDLGDGDDLLDLAHVGTYGSAIVHAGAGSDTVGVDGSTVGHVLAVIGGNDDGADVVEIVGSQVRHLGLLTGEGGDNVSLQDSVFRTLGVLLGDGEDTLNELAPSDLVHDLIRGFELPLVDELVDDLPLAGGLLGCNPLRGVGGLVGEALEDLPNVGHLRDEALAEAGELVDELPHAGGLARDPLGRIHGVVDQVMDRLSAVGELVPNISARGRVKASVGLRL